MTEDIWIGLLNSDWHDHLGTGRREDRLDNPEWLGRYLERHGMDLAGTPPGELVESLRTLRTLLRRIVDARVALQSVPAADWDALNTVLAGAPLTRRIEIPGKTAKDREHGGGAGRAVRGSPNRRPSPSAPATPRLVFSPVANRLAAFPAEIVQAFVESLTGDGESRLKVCRNPDCLWVFYDRSKNRSRRWCEDTCGNLMKVRRFRQKQKG